MDQLEIVIALCSCGIGYKRGGQCVVERCNFGWGKWRVVVLSICHVDFDDGPSVIVPDEGARARARARTGRARARVNLKTRLNVRKIFIILYNNTTLHEELLFTTPVPGICATSTFPQSETPPSLHLPSYCLSSRDCLSLHPDRQHLFTDRSLSDRYVR